MKKKTNSIQNIKQNYVKNFKAQEIVHTATNVDSLMEKKNYSLKVKELIIKKSLAKLLMKKVIALMGLDAVLDMMKENFLKSLFHIFIYNYFYLKNIIFYLQEEIFI